MRFKLLNCAKTINDFNISSSNIQRKCDKYDGKLIDQNHGHVFTGDLDIIQNKELLHLMGYGLNYREQQPPDKIKVFNSVKSGIDKYIDKASTKLNKHSSCFSARKSKILNAIKRKLDKFSLYDYNNILSKPSVLKELHLLQDDFVLVPVDKASCNIVIICKK